LSTHELLILVVSGCVNISVAAFDRLEDRLLCFNVVAAEADLRHEALLGACQLEGLVPVVLSHLLKDMIIEKSETRFHQ